MAKKIKEKDPALIDPKAYNDDKYVTDMNIGEYNKNGMRIYGANVRLMRAVPDIFDGLKVVERRILYSIGVISGAFKKRKKALSLTGDIVKIHPHGDTSPGETLVGMSQWWEMLYPLVFIDGNNGQPSGEDHSALRYLNAQMSEYGFDCFFKEWDPDVIEMRSTYNHDYMEPINIPQRFPNILVNPVTGFTFTASTSFPSFNLEESFNAVIKLIKNPDYEPVLIPDLPSKCIIVDEGQFPEICRTGKGTFKMKASIEIDHENHLIIVHSLPYHTSLKTIIDSILKLKESGNITGITKIFDGSNRHGINITLKCAPDINLETIVDILYKKTSLMDTFGVQMCFVDNYELKIFNLKQVMQKWISTRRLMKRKYSTHRIVKLREENHVLDALIDITSSDEKSTQMIHDVRHSKDEELIAKLCKRFKKLTSLQAAGLIEMKVKRFSVTNHDRYCERLKTNQEEIDYLTELITNPTLIDNKIIEELKEVIKKYAMPRRSMIEKFDPDKAYAIPDDEYILVFTKLGLVKKLNGNSKGIGKLNDGDEPIFTLMVRNRDSIVIFDRGGMCHTIKVNDIMQTESKSVGTQIGKYITLNTGIVTCLPLSSIDEKDEFVFVTEKGNIKKTSCGKYGFKSSIVSILLKKNDGLASVICTRGNSDIVVFTKRGVGNRFNTDELKETSRMSSGVIAIDVSDDDQVIGVARVSKGDNYLAMMTTKGNGKVCSMDSFETGKRRGTALRLITCSNNEEVVDIIPCGRKDKFIVAMKKEVIDVKFNDFPELTRAHHGKKLIGVPNGEQIIRFMKI